MFTILHVDSLSLIMISLISFVGLIIASFSARYLQGDRKQKTFYYNVGLLLLSVCTMVCSDHLGLFFVSWVLGNWFLTRLMMHKSEWRAARASALVARKNFTLGLIFLAIAFLGLYYQTGHASIQNILHAHFEPYMLTISLSLIFLSAMTQSALWPFHTWLSSSLNSPTPVSALMHAGLINGGGFLLARFAPLFLQQPYMLNILFIIGIFTTIIGTLWKLLQSDVKRMLAYSTMGQMGFMMVQCGLGLFPAAIAHLCWHGFFKGYLFLSSSSAAQQKRVYIEQTPKILDLLLALMCGIVGAYTFALVSGKSIFAGDTTLFLIGIALIAGMQCALAVIQDNKFQQTFLALGINIFFGALYGLSVLSIYTFVAPLHISQPQPINLFHVVGFMVLFFAWITLVYRHAISLPSRFSHVFMRLYITMLNASQPDATTVTTERNEYNY